MSLCPTPPPLHLLFVLVLTLSSCASVQDGDPEKLPEGELASMRLGMAQALVKQRDFDKALLYLRGLRQSYPRVSAVRRLMGVVLREKGMPSAAKEEFAHAIKLDPNDPENHSALGVLLDKQGAHKAAEAAHRRALKLNDDNPNYHNNLGFCLFLQKRLEDAEEEVKEAISIHPSLRVAYNNLGFIYGMMDKEEQALEAFKQAGHQAQALTNMGLLKEMRGRPVAARRYYEKALTHRPDYKPALENLKAIQPQVNQDPSDSDEAASVDGDIKKTGANR